MTESDLIEGLKNLDRTSIRELVDKYQKKVIKTTFYFTQNMEDAEELSQDIFLEVIRSVAKFRKASSLSTWIYRITINLSLNHIRKNNRNRMFSSFEDLFRKRPDGSGMASQEPTTTTTRYEEKERKELLDQSIRSLPENQKISFILSKYEGLSYQEISEVMNLSISSVESLLHRAKLNLQKKLARHFTEYVKK